MRVITLVAFHDNAKDIDRKRGEQFIVSRERFEEINAVGMAKIGKPLVGEVEADAKTTPESRGGKSRATVRKAAK